MKLQCDVCEKEEAVVLCCADEAVLCKVCDATVHAANKLSRKHQRVFLLNQHSVSSYSSFNLSSSASQLPCCDICQERQGYVFCLEDRAFICRDCDVLIHAVGSHALTHQRFLISGIKVALQSSDENTSSSIGSSSNSTNIQHGSMPTRMSVFPSADFPAEECSTVATRKEMEPASTPTTATFPFSADEPDFAAETNWLHAHNYDSVDFIFYDFSDVASSKD